MKEWLVIHKIKAMHDEGAGMSVRRIAKELKISRNTVKKYLSMSVMEIQGYMEEGKRESILDPYRDYLKHLLERFPRLSAVKAKRKLELQGIYPGASERTWRRYMEDIKGQLSFPPRRYYEPVVDMVPGVQCQIDLGEIRDISVGGKIVTVYFSVFVLSYSRLMYVSVSESPVNTSCFIRMHDEAFRYFDGVSEQCVYDQTKLVAIKEEFREVWFNDEFYRYATASSFNLRVCEGYDPESKGKVEAGVKYVKESFFYAEAFDSFPDMRERLRDWLNNVANSRVHGTTTEIPQLVYDEKEKKYMRRYLCPALFIPDESELRRVDKTSLISHRGNRYSVPMIYQERQVKIREKGDLLLIVDPLSGEEVAEHKVCEDKGKTIKNRNHYRDHGKTVSDREAELAGLIGEEHGLSICHLLKATSPSIYKDQIFGMIKVLGPYRGKDGFDNAVSLLCKRSTLRVSFARDFIEAYFSKREFKPEREEIKRPSPVSLQSYGALMRGVSV